MSSYDPRQMAQDALRLVEPPAHAGFRSFTSSDGVIALATALETATDEIERLEKILDDNDLDY